MNDYSGTYVTEDFQVERISLSTLTPETFFSTYIAKRCPVILTSIPSDLAPLQSKWTNAYLAEAAGDAQVEVEEREDASSSFGRGLKTRLPFKSVLDSIAHGAHNLYLTTQRIKLSAQGQPNLISPPLLQLRRQSPLDLPLRPTLLGRLIPMNINMWIGHAPQVAGASSGLHHDYHDNLYILLRGAKRFRLFSPRDAGRMFTRGEIAHVHANGRINYKGFETNADGSEVGSLEALRRDERKKAAERALAAAEAAVERGDVGAKEKLGKAEKEMEEVLEAYLDEDEGFDDYDLCEEEEEEGEEDGGRAAKKLRVEEDVDADPDPVELPLNFSMVDSLDAPSEKFAAFKKARCVECQIKSGEMLYLPAGWFHEVTSFSTDEKDAEAGHLALNYWMHPPDTDSFEKPYSSPFWQKNWELRNEK